MINFTKEELNAYTGNFEVYLGEGKNGRVYRGHVPTNNNHELNEMLIAVKLSKNHDSDTITQFENEIEWLPQLNHPNIVQMVGLCRSPEGIYIVYELAKGGDLLSKLEELDWQQTLDIILGLAAAIEYLHDTGLRIGDLKAPNLLLDENFQTKLGDFGTISPMATIHTKARIFMTPGYMDPSFSFRCVPSLDDDIYGFGVIILQLLTKQIFPIGTHTHIAEKTETEFAQGDPVVHEKLRVSGCSKDDASTITGLAVQLTNRPFQNAQGEWFNVYRPNIASVTQVLNTLHVVQRNAIHRGFLMLKLKAQAIKTKIMKK